jgi:hypothetical protein
MAGFLFRPVPPAIKYRAVLAHSLLGMTLAPSGEKPGSKVTFLIGLATVSSGAVSRPFHNRPYAPTRKIGALYRPD